MRTMLIVCAAMMVALVGTFNLSADEKGEGSKYKTEVIMKKAFKGPLLKKVVSGDASDEEKETLMSMLDSLAKNKPHKGEMESWKMKTGALVDAMKEVLDGKESGLAKLKKAANCASCHKMHK